LVRSTASLRAALTVAGYSRMIKTATGFEARSEAKQRKIAHFRSLNWRVSSFYLWMDTNYVPCMVRIPDHFHLSPRIGRVPVTVMGGLFTGHAISCTALPAEMLLESLFAVL
jgi:hypothetical protein